MIVIDIDIVIINHVHFTAAFYVKINRVYIFSIRFYKFLISKSYFSFFLGLIFSYHCLGDQLSLKIYKLNLNIICSQFVIYNKLLLKLFFLN